MALGAQGRDTLREFLNRGTRYILIGLVIGLAGAIATTRLLSSLLFEVKRTDPGTYLMASLLLLACALVAIFVPARRATRTDPLTALRHE
jgi:putative ABC transport system permease protein